MNRLGLYVHTIAGLRPVQWLYLPWRRVQGYLPARVPRQRTLSRAFGMQAAVQRILTHMYGDGVIDRAEAIHNGEFHFLGHTERFDVPDWHRRHVSHLWNYNLHYFDYARDLACAAIHTSDARYADRFVQLAHSWTQETRPGRGDAWEPYPLSLRIVNWSYALALLGDHIPATFRSQLTASLVRQASWLERRLEKHIQANHLQKNYYALAVAGLFFEGSAAEQWRRVGLEGSWRAVAEQVLPDGGHFERSPMYHAVMLHDLLELIGLCEAVGESVPHFVHETVLRMLDAFAVLCRQDGRIHLFNDAAHGIAPSRERIDRLARDVMTSGIPVGEGLLDLPYTGYFGFATPDGDRLLIDCGAPGPRPQPAHAHCDLLSFELDLGGGPLIVDSGVHGYDEDPFRDYARSTRAHNTVVLDDQEQTEIWGTFRVARMASVRHASHAVVDSDYRFEGAYAPFHAPATEHYRKVVLSRSRISVEDHIRGAASNAARSYLHIHPRYDVDTVDGTTVILSGAGGETIRIEWHGIENIRVGRGAGDPEGWYFPEFGRVEAAPVIVGEAAAGAHAGSFGYEIRWR